MENKFDFVKKALELKLKVNLVNAEADVLMEEAKLYAVLLAKKNEAGFDDVVKITARMYEIDKRMGELKIIMRDCKEQAKDFKSETKKHRSELCDCPKCQKKKPKSKNKITPSQDDLEKVSAQN